VCDRETRWLQGGSVVQASGEHARRVVCRLGGGGGSGSVCTPKDSVSMHDRHKMSTCSFCACHARMGALACRQGSVDTRAHRADTR
jgi:hypothetical protein